MYDSLGWEEALMSFLYYRCISMDGGDLAPVITSVDLRSLTGSNMPDVLCMGPESGNLGCSNVGEYIRTEV